MGLLVRMSYLGGRSVEQGGRAYSKNDCRYKHANMSPKMECIFQRTITGLLLTILWER